MKRYPRLWALVVFFLVVATAQVVQHLYRWFAYREERAQLVGLREELVDAGAEMIRFQLAAERLRAEIEAEDRVLENRRRGVEAYGRHALEGALPAHLYDAYRQDLDAFNERIRRRNQRLDELNAAIGRRNAAASRYHAFADSIKAVAARADEPFYPIPLPAEAAAERGITNEEG